MSAQQQTSEAAAQSCTGGGAQPAAQQPAQGEEGNQVQYTLKQTTSSGVEYNSFLVCGSVFECPARYLPLKPIGKGAYGVVCSARDLVTNQKVAIKKITNAFENAVDAKRTLREIKLLRHLNHENVIAIRDIVPPMSRSSFKDVYVVYELMDTDLHQIIRSNQPLSDDHCQYFLYQVLRGLKYIHSASILHRDLKPSNLLVNANCDLKICDFGLARSTSSTHPEFLTEYVVTRWYRAPELLLSSSDYTSAIDIWSVGCIFAELLERKALFAGKDYVHQLNLITKLLGSPTDDDLSFISSDKAKRYVRSLPAAQRRDFRAEFPHATPLALDLLQRMLVFNPLRRVTVEEALAHPYLASLHDISDEPSCPRPWDWDLDSEAITPDLVREMVLRDVAMMHPGELEPPRMASAAVPLELDAPGAGAGLRESRMHTSGGGATAEDEEPLGGDGALASSGGPMSSSVCMGVSAMGGACASASIMDTQLSQQEFQQQQHMPAAPQPGYAAGAGCGAGPAGQLHTVVQGIPPMACAPAMPSPAALLASAHSVRSM